MYLIRGINNIDLFRTRHSEVSTVATIGNFDGLHLGHQQILKTMQKEADFHGLWKLIVFTEPHAQEFFAEAAGLDASKPPRILPWQEKVRKMKELGVELAFFLKFNNQLRSMTPRNFLDKVLLRLNIKKLILGDDFRFGANREGDFNLLKKWGSENSIEVSNTETFKMEGERVSSTRIRKALTNNDFELATKLLGRPFTYAGKVVYGQQLGAQLGIPTANLWLPKNKLPISGVYIVKALLDKKVLNGIANMGIRPTIGGELPVLEVHLLDFSQSIYGQTLTVEFLKKVRDEKKFENTTALKEQIFKDITTAKNYFV
ncbi:MAG: bifunctional riboflavin kinase/FAD synthetase [SAR86 cluster bacterium]|jgi:riboflavin kinase/FMN adenylyltransferase|nr:bifunctional riboflavin kinase/FAD synthetase [SAR86 cluster bacterium]HIC26643.1 bifunctional riboflavin kinase/FAD synthetase [Gammaproteobacteria bacterium]